MGDRGNVFYVDDKADDTTYAGIYMYAHWGGSDLPEIVQNALARSEDRWDDPQYLSRIIFCEFIKDDVGSLTGYGITTWCGDNSHAIVRVNPFKQRVDFVHAGAERAIEDPDPDFSWSFEQYVKASLNDLNAAHRAAK